MQVSRKVVTLSRFAGLFGMVLFAPLWADASPVIVTIKQSARLSPTLRAEMAALVPLTQPVGGVLLSVVADNNSLGMVFVTNAEIGSPALPPVAQALRGSPLVGTVDISGVVYNLTGTFYASLEAVSEEVLRGLVSPPPQAPFDPAGTLGPHSSGRLTIAAKPFALYGDNRAATLTAIHDDLTALGVAFVLTSQFGIYTYVYAQFDENKIGIIELIRRVRALPWVASAGPDSLLFPAVVTVPFARYFVVSGRGAAPGAPTESFVIRTFGTYGGDGFQLAEHLRHQAYVPLKMRIAPRTAADPVYAGFEAYTKPWVVRELLAVGLADFGPGSGAENTRNAPLFTALPSEISRDVPGWIATNGDIVWSQGFRVVAEITPGAPGALVNLSARAQVGRDERVMIGGFVVQGGSTRTLLVRALGPSLSAQGVANPLTNPRIQIVGEGNTPVADNDDWSTGPRAAELTARFPALVPGDPRESALLATFYPGVYTVIISSADGAEGVGLVELYDIPD